PPGRGAGAARPRLGVPPPPLPARLDRPAAPRARPEPPRPRLALPPPGDRPHPAGERSTRGLAPRPGPPPGDRGAPGGGGRARPRERPAPGAGGARAAARTGSPGPADVLLLGRGPVLAARVDGGPRPAPRPLAAPRARPLVGRPPAVLALPPPRRRQPRAHPAVRPADRRDLRPHLSARGGVPALRRGPRHGRGAALRESQARAAARA